MADFKLIFMCLGSISLEYYTSRNINGSYLVLKFYFIMKMNCITEKPIERQQVVSLLIQDKKSKKTLIFIFSIAIEIDSGIFYERFKCDGKAKFSFLKTNS